MTDKSKNMVPPGSDELLSVFGGLNRQGRDRLLVVAQALAQDVSEDDAASLKLVSDYFDSLNETGKRRFLKVAAALSRSVGG